MKMAYIEIEKDHKGRTLSDLEKNKLAIQFIDMNKNPKRFFYLERFS